MIGKSARQAPKAIRKPKSRSAAWTRANFLQRRWQLAKFPAQFHYGDRVRPLDVSRIGMPADAMMYMDTITHYVYSPVDVNYGFTLDMNGDGTVDTMPQYPDTPFNSGRPTVHNNGSNLALLDGHVERVIFKKLWQIDAAKKVVHSFWYMEDLADSTSSNRRFGAIRLKSSFPSPFAELGV